MATKSAKKEIIYVAGFLGVLVLIYYGRTFFTWFQQDEWDWIGRYTYFNSISKIPFWEAFKSSLFPHPRYRFTPLFDAFWAILVAVFKLNFSGYVSISLSLHFVNSLLLFVLIYKLTNNTRLGLLVSSLFATSSIGQKAVTWIATSFNTLPSALFSILIIYSLNNYLNPNQTRNVTPKAKSLSFIYLLCFLGLWFKENTIGIILLLPAFAFILSKNNKKQALVRIGISTVLFISGYFLLRFLLSRIGLTLHTTGYPDFGRFLNFNEYLQLAFWTPLRSVVNVFIFPQTLISIASYFRGTHDIWAETIGVNRVTLAFALLIFLALRMIYKKIISSNKKFAAIYWVSILLIFTSTIISSLLVLRGTSALVYIIRSRDLYISVMGASIILGLLIHQFISHKNLSIKLLGVLILVLYLSYHYANINKDILNVEIGRARLRKYVTSFIYTNYPTIPAKTIIYVDKQKSDEPFFQTGFGRTLLVWYTYHNHPGLVQFLQDDYLYLPGSTGYKEYDKYGFGYFDDLNLLTKTLQDNGLTADNVFSFSFDKQTTTISDQTQSVRTTLIKRQ